MKTLLFAILLSPAFLFFGCSNTSYDIETVEDNSPLDFATHQSASKQTQTALDAVKADIKNENFVEQKKTSDTKENTKFFTIQIGAFASELRAKEMVEESRSVLEGDVNYTNIDGLFKIRIGPYNSLVDACTMLEKVKSIGYKDSFITAAK